MSSQWMHYAVPLSRSFYPIHVAAGANTFINYAISPSIVFQITTTLNFGFSRFSIALFVSYCIQAFRNVIRIENHGSGTVCSSKGETCYTTVIALHRTPCGSEFNHWQETMVMVLWFPWLQKGGGGSTA